MRDAIAYIRVSTENQGQDGAGLDLQLTRIEAYAKAAGFRIVEIFKDMQTGTHEDSAKRRPGVRAAIECSQKHRLPIIVDGLDRFSRNTKRLEELVADGKLKVISARSGEGAGRAVIMGEAARAQAEVERISRTTKEGLRLARERGVTLGNTINLPEAQKKGAASNKSKAERQARELAPVVKKIRASGCTTKEAIADELNKRAYRTARGERWNKHSIRRLLDRIADTERPAQPDCPVELDRPDEHHSKGDPRQSPMWGMF
jgi:DNA invertase Pin-like site-specific DNA recombinase